MSRWGYAGLGALAVFVLLAFGPFTAGWVRISLHSWHLVLTTPQHCIVQVYSDGKQAPEYKGCPE